MNNKPNIPTQIENLLIPIREHTIELIEGGYSYREISKILNVSLGFISKCKNNHIKYLNTK